MDLSDLPKLNCDKINTASTCRETDKSKKMSHLWFSQKQINNWNQPRIIYVVQASAYPDIFKVGTEVRVSMVSAEFADSPKWDDAIYIGVGYFSRIEKEIDPLQTFH